MGKMLTLLSTHKPCFLFQQFFLECLPEDIHIQLVDTKVGNFWELAK